MFTDQIYPFNLPLKTPLTVNTRVGCEGILELQAVKGVIFLVKGQLSKGEFEEALASKPVPTWDLAAVINGDPSTMYWDGNESSFTLFSSEESVGYVRIVEPWQHK